MITCWSARSCMWLTERMNIGVMPAVTTVIRPIGTSITTEATNRPICDVGVLSP